MLPTLPRLALLWLLLASTAWGADTTLNVKSSYDVGEPIEISVTAPTGAKVTWAFSPGLITKDAQADGLRLWGWAKPGKQTVKATVVVVKTRKVTVFVPDPNFPNDVTKAKLDTLEIFESYTSEVLQDEFTQLGGVEPPPVPPVPPNPPNPPVPPQPVGIKAAVLVWEWSKLPQPKPAVDTAVDEFLDAQAGVGNWRKWDDDFVAASFDPEPRFQTDLKFLKDLYIKGKVDRASAGLGDDAPWVEIELKDGRKVGRAMDDNTLQFLKSYGG